MKLKTCTFRRVFLDRVIHFGETLGDQVKGRSPKKLKSLIEVPNVVDVKVQILSYSMILISSPWCVPRHSCALWEKFGDQVKDSSPKKAKSLIEVPYVALLKVQVPSFNLNLISSP